MSTYNERAARHNAHLAEQAAFAERLTEAHSAPGVREVLEAIVNDHTTGRLEEDTLEKVIEVLFEPVAFAIARARERGWTSGAHEARQGVAYHLGLGRLERPE